MAGARQVKFTRNRKKLPDALELEWLDYKHARRLVTILGKLARLKLNGRTDVISRRFFIAIVPLAEHTLGLIRSGIQPEQLDGLTPKAPAPENFPSVRVDEGGER
jgi:hypothetical protein